MRSSAAVAASRASPISRGIPRAVNHSATRATSRARDAGPCGLPTTSTTCGRSITEAPPPAPPAVDQQVVGGQVAVGQAVAREAAQGVDQLAPQVGQLVRVGTQLGQAG